MLISPNIGALAGYLKRIVGAQAYVCLKNDVEHLMHQIPAVGDWMYVTAKQIVDAVKTYAIPGLLLRERGVEYHEPISGHGTNALVKNLNEIKEKKGPLLLHTITTKGKGYAPAETDQVKWHGPSAFDVKTATLLKTPSKITELHLGLCQYSDSPGRARSEYCGHHSGHAGRDGAGQICPGTSGPFLRRRNRGTARGYFCSGNGYGRIQTDFRHLFHFSSACL